MAAPKAYLNYGNMAGVEVDVGKDMWFSVIESKNCKSRKGADLKSEAGVEFESLSKVRRPLK